MSDLKPLVSIDGRQPRGGVLVVDDEGLVRRAAERMINRLGYEVCSAANGQEAVEAISRDPRAFSVVVLDMLMPGMDGKETFQQLRTIAPGLNVLLSSGLSETEGGPVNLFVRYETQKPSTALSPNLAWSWA